jgi:phosphatidylserine/phosphatidylglycerophosphate/cardiolipin synthase-like enzyme
MTTDRDAAPVAVPAALFEWDALAEYKQERRFLDHYPADFRTFWSPRDRVHDLLVALLSSAQHSLVLNMFGYADDELDAIIRSKLTSEHVYVQMSLDSTQAAGRGETKLLAKWSNDAFGNSIAIGQSDKHAISHLKILIVDGIYTVKGSTNWSLSGEGKQDNELTLSRNPVIAAETRAVLDLNHDSMLKQMAAKRKAKPRARRTTSSTSRSKPSASTQSQRRRRQPRT